MNRYLYTIRELANEVGCSVEQAQRIYQAIKSSIHTEKGANGKPLFSQAHVARFRTELNRLTS